MKDAALSAGKNVTAFIDRRAEEIGDINGIPVYATFPSAKSGDCLIIALQNALQHDDIAKQANEHGFERILYVPMNSEIAQDKAQIMRNAYNSVILNDWVAEQRPIPNYSEMYSSDALASALPDEKPANNNKYIVVRVPIDVVYTSLEANEFSDMPLAAFHPYNILFDYFESKSPKEPDTPNAYLERNAQRDYTGKKDVKKTIAMRGECIEKYTEFFQDGLDFALSSAPLAQWNARACFNLCEGHHRTIWLLRNGIYYLPLRISIDDYKKYANIEALKEIRTDVSFINIQHLTPISNPCFNKSSFHNKFF